MPVIASLIDAASPAFAANAARMAERLAEMRALEARVREESASKRDKFEKRGQLASAAWCWPATARSRAARYRRWA